MIQFAPKITGDFRLTKDPELRYTASGAAVVNLRVAGQRYLGKVKEGDKEVAKYAPIYVTMVAWRKRAEQYAQSLKKGDLVSIEAQLNMHSWKKEGDQHETTVLEGIVDRCSLRSRPTPKAEGAPAADQGSEEDIPESLGPAEEDLNLV